MKNINIIYKKIDELKPYKNNPRKNDKAVKAVADSIKEFGFKVPIILDSNMEIIAGHTRLKAAIRLKYKEVPCIIADDLTPDQARAFRLVDNKVGEFAEWDIDLLNIELSEIELDLTPFEFKIEKTLNDIEEDDYEVVIPDEPKSKKGDIYILGNHRLMCGDSTNKDDVRKLMNGNKADMLFTDPPYGVAFNGRSGNHEIIMNDDLSDTDFYNFISSTIDIIKWLDIPTYYIWCNWKFYGILQSKLDYKACIVWAKNVFGLGRGYRHQHEFCLFNGKLDEGINNESDLWSIAKDTNYAHPTQKPVALCARALSNHKEVKIVLDLFGGSGSTLIASEQLDRSCYMMELDEKYVDVIIDRWEKFTGRKAVKVE